MFQIQRWPFGSGNGRAITREIADPAEAASAVHAALDGRANREVVVWYPDHSILHVVRDAPDASWRTAKGTLPKEGALKCGACARIGTNDTRPMAHSPSCPKGQG